MVSPPDLGGLEVDDQLELRDCSMGKPAAWRMLLAMSPADDLRNGIREKILAGVLPKLHCRMTWYGPGTGGICVACERPIAASDVEVECDLPGGGTIRLHR